MDFILGPAARAAGYRVVSFPEIGSTNSEGLRRARDGDAGRLWLVTGRQTAGRGRRGRPWETEAGNLAASLLLVLDQDAAVAATLGFVAGLALDEALRRVAPALAAGVAPDQSDRGGLAAGRLRLKWPNDVLLDGAKLAGILLEAEKQEAGRLAVVIGIGVNITSAPAGTPYPATALARLGARAGAADVFLALSDAWASVEKIWDGGRGFAAIRRLWLDRAAGVGGEVAVRTGDQVVKGTFETIDETGRLVIRTPDGERNVVSAGEVHFGGAATARS